MTPEKLQAFCAALAETGIVARACKAIGISRETAYRWRREDPDFEKGWDRALEVGITALEDEAHRRAFRGVPERHYKNGELVDTTRKYSDTLAIFLLKAHRPDRYRERVDVAHSGGVNLTVSSGVPEPGPDLSELA